MAQINLISPATFTSGVLIGDESVTTGGSIDSIPQLTQAGGQPASIALEIQSILGALLLPRVTDAQMNAMNPTNGMLLYNTSHSALFTYSSGSWAVIGSSGSGTVSSITAGANIVLTPSPITTVGSVALSTTLTGLTSAVIGNITISGSDVASSASLVLQTNGTTTALTLDTSQNAVFAGTVKSGNITLTTSTIESSGSLILATNGSTAALTLGTSQNATFAGNIILGQSGSSGNSLNIQLGNGTTTSFISNNSGALIIDAVGTQFIVQTASNVTALTIDTSQNATFVGSITSNTTTGAILFPRVTTTQMNAIGSPTNGMIVYNSTVGGFFGYIGGAWTQIADVGTDVSLTAGANMTLTPNPILGIGTIALSTALTGITSAVIGNTTLTGSNIDGSGSLVLATNGTTTALTLDTSQNAQFAGTVTSGNITLSTSNINSSGSLVLGTNGSTTALTLNTSQNATFAGTVTSGNITLSTNNVNSGSGHSLVLGTNGSTTALTLDTSQNATFAGTVKSGNITLSTSNINSSATLVFGTNGSTTALTLDASQNATFAGTIVSGTITLSSSNINSSGSLILATNGSTAALTIGTTQNATFAGAITAANGKFIAYGSASQSISATTVTAINFENQVVNTLVDMSVTSNNTFTYTGSGTGYYWVSYSTYLSGLTTGDFYNAWIKTSASTVNYGQCYFSAVNSHDLALSGSMMLALTNGQTFTISVNTQSSCTASSSATTKPSTISIYRIP